MSITVENLSKHYGTQKAVDQISFKVNTGEILGFLGPNGAGKTTTMKILTCFIKPSGGNAWVDGVSVLDNPNEVKRKIGYLPEHNPLYLDMPVYDYLSFAAALQGVPTGKIPDAVKKMISVCGLNSEKHKDIAELSKGYRQRVGLAQALIHDPKILILDEPTTGLDPNQQAEIRTLIRNIGKEKTVIFSTHILPEVEATCDRVMIIHQGKLKEEGTTADIKRKTQGKELLTVTIEDAPDSNRLWKELQSIDTVEMVDVHKERPCSFTVQSKQGASSKREIYGFCKEKGYVLTELHQQETSLEDVFRLLTT
ncbi:MAG: ATP-binding cassette domain-containing protein [Bacteroidetes bacterium]|jgi:ABC-2 type transport system ATP-binding protein|nr:ATP-binding cassette domain-containing protein [Bacteroidota bacterium]